VKELLATLFIKQVAWLVWILPFTLTYFVMRVAIIWRIREWIRELFRIISVMSIFRTPLGIHSYQQLNLRVYGISFEKKGFEIVMGQGFQPRLPLVTASLVFPQ
jgi:hypothetical protein